MKKETDSRTQQACVLNIIENTTNNDLDEEEVLYNMLVSGTPSGRTNLHLSNNIRRDRGKPRLVIHSKEAARYQV